MRIDPQRIAAVVKPWKNQKSAFNNGWSAMHSAWIKRTLR